MKGREDGSVVRTRMVHNVVPHAGDFLEHKFSIR